MNVASLKNTQELEGRREQSSRNKSTLETRLRGFHPEISLRFEDLLTGLFCVRSVFVFSIYCVL